MVQCEMCGAETGAPKTIKVEGAELDVCDDCTDFGTEVRDDSTSSASTKYSTSSDTEDAGSTTRSTSKQSSGGGGGGGSGRNEMLDDVDELATDYDERIRAAREDAGLSQEELAKDLNEKASLIRKLEHGDMLPSDDVQSKLERGLGISLAGGAEAGDADWDSDSEAGSYTLGEMAERKD